MNAICVFTKDMPHNKLGIEGKIFFTQKNIDLNTEITIALKGFKPNAVHAIHIHESSDFSNGCHSAGPHYNPYCKYHGCCFISGKNRHVGDLINNIKADDNGNVLLTFSDDLVDLLGEFTVINRSIVIHEGVDDLGLGYNEDSLITGNAGGRAACAKIEAA